MDELLAKPDKKLVHHLIEVYEVGKRIAHHLGLNEELTHKALIACLFHDIGKATKSFQRYIRKKARKAYPHALASFPFVLVTEHRLSLKPYIASAAVLTHHSPLSPWIYEGWNPPEYCKGVLDSIKIIAEKVPDINIDPNAIYADTMKLNDPSGVLHRYNKKLLIMFKNMPIRKFAAVKTVLHLADWLASSEKYDESVLFLKGGKSLVREFVRSSGYKLWNFQKEASDKENILSLRLRAPTGSGKTEALLLWCGDIERIIYLLPTQATVNAMWKRLTEIYGEECVGIAHGRANYILRKEYEEKGDDDIPRDYKLFASVFAKPVVVATIDQFLMGYMNGRHWEEKQTLSRNSAVIIDEVHSYEPYTLGLLKKVFEKDSPQKSALASATLPDFLLNLFGGEYFVEADPVFWNRQRYKIHIKEEAFASIIPEAINLARSGKKVLMIVNTVNKAQELFKIVKDKWQNTKLLHSRFIYRDRASKENEIIKPSSGIILISTQIVEVSLDISYDVLFTELAPIDAIIQRMGRVNRQGINPPVDVNILAEIDKPSIKVYGEELLNLSKEILYGLDNVPTEKDFIEATNRLYEEYTSWDTFQNDFHEGMQHFDEIRSSLGTYTIDLSDDEFRNKFITRKGIYSIDVIPDIFIQDAYELIEQKKQWKIIELTVPVHGYWIKIYPQFFTASKDLPYFTTSLKYRSDIGLIFPNTSAVDNEKVEIW